VAPALAARVPDAVQCEREARVVHR